MIRFIFVLPCTPFSLPVSSLFYGVQFFLGSVQMMILFTWTLLSSTPMNFSPCSLSLAFDKSTMCFKCCVLLFFFIRVISFLLPGFVFHLSVSTRGKYLNLRFWRMVSNDPFSLSHSHCPQRNVTASNLCIGGWDKPMHDVFSLCVFCVSRLFTVMIETIPNLYLWKKLSISFFSLRIEPWIGQFSSPGWR